MKKAGIMTWFTYDNFGSLLQAYALQETIKTLNLDVEIINYQPKSAYRIKENYGLKVLKKIRNKTQGRKYKLPKNDKYNEFRNKYLNIGTTAWTDNELYQLNDRYDVFVCGSDQIWAPTVFDKNYFLDFVAEEYKKIAYAPSIGLPVIENKYVEAEMKRLISRFSYLSIREKEGQSLIQKICGKKPEVVLDPTLLIDEQGWEKIIDHQNNTDSSYALAYFLGDNDKYITICRKLANKYGLNLVLLPTKPKDMQYKEVVEKSQGPEDFLRLIKNAKCVFTDSFHGTIFSINFKVPFVTFKRFKDNKLSQNSRVYNALRMFELQERLYDHNQKYFENNLLDINFKKSNEILEREKKRSIRYLSEALNESLKHELNKKVTITSNCCGCGVCAVACPQNCITVALNRNGFYEAKIDYNLCISCKQCVRVCGQNIKRLSIPQVENQKIYSGYWLNREKLKNVSSGGFCTFISEKALEKQIPVVGVHYSYINNRAEHILITNDKELWNAAGSKYLQSYSLEGFKYLSELEKGIIIGTPCQIASVDRYLIQKKKREKFLLIDIICHGVPSYLVWKKYLNGETINSLKFRDKRNGWRSKTMSYHYDSMEYCETEEKDLFFHFFNVGKTYNSCCYECSFRDQGCSDIRVADYWGPRFLNNKEGRSMIIPMSQKGNIIINDLLRSEEFHVEEGDIQDCLKYQQMKNLRRPLNYNEIFEMLRGQDSLRALDKKINCKQLAKVKIYRILNRMRKR